MLPSLTACGLALREDSRLMLDDDLDDDEKDW